MVDTEKLAHLIEPTGGRAVSMAVSPPWLIVVFHVTTLEDTRVCANERRMRRRHPGLQIYDFTTEL